MSAGCEGSDETVPADNPATTAGSEGVIAAELKLPASELFGPVTGEGAIWLRAVGTGEVFRVNPETNQLTATIDVGPGCCLAVGQGRVGDGPGPEAAAADRPHVERSDCTGRRRRVP
jgi:hypothetical protein